MNRERVARELLRMAKSLLAIGGKYVAVRDLPVTIQRALKSLRFGRRDIEVIESTSWSVSTAFEGNRAVAITVNIGSGRITDRQQGSWGGPNPWEDRDIDKRGKQPVPNGSAVIAGEMGGRGNFLRIYVRPGDLEELVGEDDAVELTDDEATALNIIRGIKSGYRGDEFRRNRLGDYSSDNPLVQSLAKKGLVKIMRSGIRVTTKGRNVQLSRYL